MTRRPASVHWLHGNAQERTPWRVLIADTETAIPDTHDPDRQTLRLWSATLIRRHGIDPRAPRREHFRGRTADELARLVHDHARADRTLWLVFHNLSFDLAVTELPVQLGELGWHVTEGALTSDSPWCRMARGSRRLVMVDSWSFLPASVADLGRLVGLSKRRLPLFGGTDAEWWDRCDRDVAIVARALISAMDWWDAHHLGNWSITGPATGWSSYRHRRPSPRVLIDPDPAARAFEMAAVTGGRKEARRLGRQPAGLYADLDISTAHLAAMASLELPFRRLAWFDRLPLGSPVLRSGIRDVLAWCEVETERPRYPWTHAGATWYPVGHFRALLPGPELREAADRGELRAIGRGIVYLTSPHMVEWALWLATLLDEATPDVPPSVRLMAKSWSRSVPGKWAGHTSEVVSKVPDARPGWAVEHAVLMPERRPADLLRIGGERWTIIRDEWADDAFPAILAWIQSATRVAIGRLADMLPEGIVSMNTDGLIVDVADVLDAHPAAPWSAVSDADAQLEHLAALCASWDAALDPFSVRVKRAARLCHVISPQHLVLGRERRLAGIPARAVKLADGRYWFRQWPKLRVQLEREDGPGYRTREARVEVPEVPPLGWLLSTGRVAPVTVEGDRILPPSDGWPDEPGPYRGDLAEPERQHATLRAVLAVPAAGAAGMAPRKAVAAR